MTVSHSDDPSIGAAVSAPVMIHEQLLAEQTAGSPDQNYIQEIYRDSGL